MSETHAFGPRTRRILQALCDRLFDPGRDDRTSPADIRLADEMSRALVDTPSMTRVGLALLLWALQFVPLLVVGRLRRFTRLALEDQERFVHRLLEHPLRPVRMAFVGLNLMASVHYWEHPRVRDEVGYGESVLLPEEVAAAVPS